MTLPPLGVRARDRISGYEGIVVAHLIYLYRSPQVQIDATSRNDKGKPLGAEWFEASRVERVDAAAPLIGFQPDEVGS